MSAVLGAPPPPPRPPGGSNSPGTSGAAPAVRGCIRHPARQLSEADVAAGFTRCTECREKAQTSTANVNFTLTPCSVAASSNKTLEASKDRWLVRQCDD
jgi:hypothetical protein